MIFYQVVMGSVVQEAFITLSKWQIMFKSLRKVYKRENIQ